MGTLTGSRAAGITAVVLLASLLAGCWDRIEVQDLDVVSAVAFDAAPQGVRVTTAIVLPQNLSSPGGGAAGGGGGGGTKPTQAVVSAVGPTIGEAVTRIGQGLSGHIFWGHTRVVILGQGLARRGIQPVLDFFARGRTSRLTVDLLVTPGEAGALLEVGPPYRSPASDVLYEHLRRRLEPRAPVFRVSQALASTGAGVLIPEVVANRPAPPAAAGGSGGGASQSQTPEQFLFSGAGVVDHRARLVGWLSEDQLRGALWLLGRTVHSTVAVTGPDGSVLTLRMDSLHIGRRALLLPDGSPAVEVDVDTSDSIEQVDAGTPPLDDPRYLSQISDVLAGRIRLFAGRALAAAHSDRVDFLEFDRLVAAYEPARWLRLKGDWPEAFARLPLVLRVRAHVRRTGNVVKPSQ